MRKTTRAVRYPFLHVKMFATYGDVIFTVHCWTEIAYFGRVGGGEDWGGDYVSVSPSKVDVISLDCPDIRVHDDVCSIVLFWPHFFIHK